MLLVAASFAADPAPSTPANEARSQGTFVDDVRSKRADHAEQAAEAMEQQRQATPAASPAATAKPHGGAS